MDIDVKCGNPDRTKISTSYIERQNLTMRMGMRRATRLTNGFSKKAENFAAAVALHYMHYNFARPHMSLKNPYPRTPAMAAGIGGSHLVLERDRGATRLKLTHYPAPGAMLGVSQRRRSSCLYGL